MADLSVTLGPVKTIVRRTGMCISRVGVSLGGWVHPPTKPLHNGFLNKGSSLKLVSLPQE